MYTRCSYWLFSCLTPRLVRSNEMTVVVAVAQSVRAPGCGPGGRGFESHQPPQYFPDHLVMNICNIGFPVCELLRLLHHQNLKC